MEPSLTSRLLSYARDLQQAATFRDLLDVTRREAEEALGFAHAWMFVAESEDADELRLIDASGGVRDAVWEDAPVLKVRGDAMIEEIMSATAPVVVVDARTDPRTDKKIVAQLGNRTIVNVPLRLLDKPFGALGVGTFGDEGVRPPTPAQLDHLIGMAGQLAVAAGRIRFQEERDRAERERQEYDRRLRQVQKLESIGLLADGIAHDFNNLLTVILSGVELARLAVTDPKAAAQLDAALAAADRARDLSRQLLGMSRARERSLAPLDLDDRLTALIGMLRSVLPSNVSIELVSGGPLPRVDGDASQLDQVFMNLCINARDAMPGGGRITVRTSGVTLDGSLPGTHAGAWVRITVSDTGTGMPPEVVERVFEPFFTTKGEHGTGLGLAVAYGTVRQHGGLIQVTSEVGVGTTFEVLLPAREPAAGEAPAPNGEARAPSAREAGAPSVGAVALPPAPPPSPPATDGRRVLVVDDDAAVRSFVVEALTPGFVVDTAADGWEGLSRALAAPPDLVVTDLGMPRMSGDEMIAKLRAHRDFDAVPILVLSGVASDAERVRLLRMGAQDYVLKPFGRDELAARAANLVALKRARDVLESALEAKGGDLEALARDLAARGEELARTTERLRATNRDLERFTWSASHDLREPARTVYTFAQLLAARAGPQLAPEERTLLDHLLQGAARMHALSQGLVDYASVGAEVGELAEVDLGAVLAATQAALGDAITRSGATLGSDPLPRVRGDEAELRLLLQNLLDNALKFAGDAPPRVHLSAESRDDAWEICVADHGTGFDPALAARLFQPFLRLHGREVEGTGLGLATCRRIVERHGGRIWATSEVGQGARFCFTLPRA